MRDVLAGLLAGLATLILRIARRLGVPHERFERHGWLPIPVHYYHPYPRSADLVDRGYWESVSTLRGVALDVPRCLEVLRGIGAAFGTECQWPERSQDPRVYHWSNGNFGYASAAVAHAMVRHLKPRRVIEVGSGYSTHILSAALRRNGEQGRLTIIEPHPGEMLDVDLPHLERRLHQRVETVDPALFGELQENDVLFIDSSHVLRYGGDVAFLYLDVLPSLARGVAVHIHDIHLPEPYPRVYFEQARYVWNEQFLLHAFLCHNADFEVLLPCFMLHRANDDVFRAAFPHYDPARHRPGSSFWMRRVR